MLLYVLEARDWFLVVDMFKNVNVSKSVLKKIVMSLSDSVAPNYQPSFFRFCVFFPFGVFLSILFNVWSRESIARNHFDLMTKLLFVDMNQICWLMLPCSNNKKLGILDLFKEHTLGCRLCHVNFWANFLVSFHFLQLLEYQRLKLLLITSAD